MPTIEEQAESFKHTLNVLKELKIHKTCCRQALITSQNRPVISICWTCGDTAIKDKSQKFRQMVGW